MSFRSKNVNKEGTFPTLGVYPIGIRESGFNLVVWPPAMFSRFASFDSRALSAVFSPEQGENADAEANNRAVLSRWENVGKRRIPSDSTSSDIRYG
jgi:hypothetical protein